LYSPVARWLTGTFPTPATVSLLRMGVISPPSPPVRWSRFPGPATIRRIIMGEPVTAATPHYLKTPDAAIHLGLSARTLEKHRCFGTGPIFRKLGGRIVYAIDDLDAWAAIGTRRSTSDPGNGVVHPAKRLPTDCV